MTVLGCLFVLVLLFTFVQADDLFPVNLLDFITNNTEGLCGEQWKNLSRISKLKMIDASTKIPEGILVGNLFQLGNFDECYSIRDGDIYGKYCLGTLPFPKNTGLQSTYKSKSNFHIHPQLRMLPGNADNMGIYIARCVPSGCKAEEIGSLAQFKEENCHSKDTEPELTGGAIATIVFLACILAIVIASTIFDIILYYKNKQAPNEISVAFSLLSNGRKLFKSSSNSDQLLCLNGIKAISMMWVILGHEYAFSMMSALSNYADLDSWRHELKSMIIQGATVSVDTFFLVGGLVTVYAFLKATDKGVPFNIPLYYIHRYLRLTPAFAIIILIEATLVKYISNGPLWYGVEYSLEKYCKSMWWSALLYIQNYVYDEGMCVTQSWYLNVDMQLFLLSPLILVPLTRWTKPTLAALAGLCVAGIIVPFTLGYVYELDAFTMGVETAKKYYMQPHARFAPYVIGMAMGYIIYQMKKTKKVQLSMPVVLLMWLVCIVGMIICVFGSHGFIFDPYNRWVHSLFLGFNRPLWSIFVSGVIFLCITEYGGPINTFLSHAVFQFITKLSYSMYLVHIVVITVRGLSMRTTTQFSDYRMMNTFWGDFMVTLGLSLGLCLMFESPMIIIEKQLFGNFKKQTNKPQV